jgi:hypothetical protein
MGEIKWNLARKAEREKEEAKLKALKLAAKIFSDWKYKLTKKALPKDQLIPKLYELREKVLTAVAADPELKEWRAFCHDLIDDKIAAAMTDSIVARNDITQYVPTFGQEEPKAGDLILAGDIKKPRSFPFRSAQEFLQVPFVQSFSKRDDFAGFIRRGYFIDVLFKDGELLPVGKVSNTIGIVWIPTLEQFQAELAKSAVKKN